MVIFLLAKFRILHQFVDSWYKTGQHVAEQVDSRQTYLHIPGFRWGKEQNL